MMEQPTNPAVQPAAQQPAIPARKPWAVGKKERRLLPLSLALAYLIASASIWKWLGLGMTVLTAAWYTVLFLYR